MPVSTASRVGTGNIIGVSTALCLGGFGSVFWMWLIALIGSASGFVESTLGQIYKVPRQGGGFLGGPAYYIKNVLGNKSMAVLFAVLISVTYGLIFNSVQSNTIAISCSNAFGIDRAVIGGVVTALTALVIFGGITRIAKVAEISRKSRKIGSQKIKSSHVTFKKCEDFAEKYLKKTAKNDILLQKQYSIKSPKMQ